jgi:hypothetical protein
VTAGKQNTVLRLVTPPTPTVGALTHGLVELHRAVKGAGFYPHGHPARVEALQRVYDALKGLVAERELVLSVHRQGITVDGEGVEGNSMVLQLAHECFIRRVSCVTIMQDLLIADLEGFIRLLNGDPHKIAAAGGFARQLERAGISTIWINQKDLDLIWEKRARASFGEPGDDREGLGELDIAAASPDAPLRRTAGEILELMAQEKLDPQYQALARELCDRLQENPGETPLLPVLTELLRQYREKERSLPQREFALFVLKQLAEDGERVLLAPLESRSFTEKENIHRILAVLGGKGAYWLIQRICLAPGLYERKALATALVNIGPPAIAPTLAMLNDERWYVVRNMVAILGELRCAECVGDLEKPLYHEDVRVRKEAVRALMKMGGEQAEAALIPLLEEADEGLVRHAVLALGLMRSGQAVPALLWHLERRDLLLKGLEVKKEILVALGRIGDRRATAPLLKLLKPKGWPVLGRWLELKVGVAAALGLLGDETALPVLSALAGGSGALAEACREAQDAIERVSGGEL